MLYISSIILYLVITDDVWPCVCVCVDLRYMRFILRDALTREIDAYSKQLKHSWLVLTVHEYNNSVIE